MMRTPLEYDGTTLIGWTVEGARDRGIPGAVIGAAVLAQARSDVVREAEEYRARLATTSPGKLASYRIKEEIARDPDAADPEELAILDQEAAARGLARADLLTAIRAQAGAYRRAALMVEMLEASTAAALAALDPAAADIEAQVAAALTTARTQAEAALVAARAAFEEA
ncbi:MAG: hypothetical protein ACU0CO_15015 [Shimia sp.]